MNSEQFSEALEQISGPLIEDAALAYDKTAKRRRKLLQFMPRVCAAILTLALLTGLLFSPGKDPEIITAPGILKVYAYDLENADGVDVAKLEGIELEEGVEFPVNAGWSGAMSLYYGLPLTLCVSEEYFGNAEITFEITIDGGEFFRELGGEYGMYYFGPAYLGQNFTLENGQTIYWHNIETDMKNWSGTYDEQKIWDYIRAITEASEKGEQLPAEMGSQICPETAPYLNGVAYADVMIKADGNIVGCMVIKIYTEDQSLPEGSPEYLGLRYYAMVMQSVCYPLQADGSYQKVSRRYAEALMDSWKQ